MQETIGKLKCQRRPGEDDSANVVLLHGFGANSRDLFPLAEYLDPEGRWNFYFPDAPLTVPLGGMMTGLGWFPISVRDLDGGINSAVRPPGLDQSTEMVYDMLFHLNSKKLVLGGFSQGAMVSTDVALSNPRDVHGLVILSGTLLDAAAWTAKVPEFTEAGGRYFQSHGSADNVLAYAGAVKLNDALKAGGLPGSFTTFGGGHDIPMPVLQKVRPFLESVLA